MAEIVNLRSVRKRKARAEKEQTAETNRVLHGRTKAEKQAEQAIRARSVATHESHRREPVAPTGKEGEP